MKILMRNTFLQPQKSIKKLATLDIKKRAQIMKG